MELQNEQQQQPRQHKSPKEECLGIMFEVFEIIESLDIQEGKYIQLSNLLRDMNINVNRIQELRTIIINNTYYTNRERRINTLRRKRLTEAEKANNPDYSLCNCGRYIKFNKTKPEWIMNHYNSLVHQQGIRNRKYAGKKIDKEQIDDFIRCEIACQAFIIKHLEKKGINIDEEDEENED